MVILLSGFSTLSHVSQVVHRKISVMLKMHCLFLWLYGVNWTAGIVHTEYSMLLCKPDRLVSVVCGLTVL